MKHNLRKIYSAPQAEIICFAPLEAVTTSGWTAGGGSADDIWNRHWGIDWNILRNASITGNVLWYDAKDSNGNTKNYEID